MSHYTVLVIGEDPEKLLEPYDENLEVPEYVKLTRDQARKDRVFEIRDLKKILKKDPEGKNYNIDFIKKKLAEIEAMSDEDYFKDKIKWEEKFNDKGEPLSDSNPKSEWDFYQIGGRWLGNFILKHGAKPAMPSTPTLLGAGDKEYLARVLDTTRCDSARLRDIDWDRMFEEELAAAEKEWARYREALLLEPAEKVLRLFPDMPKIYPFGTKKDFMKKARKERVLISYAVITEDGEWHAPGKMGWWGMSSDDEEDRKAWDKKFWKRFIEPLGPNTKLTMVDCHI